MNDLSLHLDAPLRRDAERALRRYLTADFRGLDHRAALLGLPLLLEFILLKPHAEDVPLWASFDSQHYVDTVIDLEDEGATFLKAILREALVFFDCLIEEGANEGLEPMRARTAEVLQNLGRRGRGCA